MTSVSQKPQLQQLVVLQGLDDEIAEHKKLLAEIPVQIDARRLELEAKKKTLSIAKEEIDELQKNRKAIESEVQGENDHMAKAKTKLPAVKTNKEYTAILAEVGAIKEKVTGLEDKELEIMEALEEKQKEIPVIEKKCKEEDADFQEYKAKKDGELSRMKQELGPRVAEREDVMSQLEKMVIQRYEKIAKSRERKAVALLRGNICQGCFQQILPQMVVDVKVGEKIQQCSNCMRFLYWEEKTDSNDSLKPKTKNTPNSSDSQKIITTNRLNFSYQTQKLLTAIEGALEAKFEDQCDVVSYPGSSSIKLPGKVWAKLIPQDPSGCEYIIIGVSAKIPDQNWGSYKFSETTFLVGAGNNQEFHIRDLPNEHQAAIDESIEIIEMLLEKLE